MTTALPRLSRALLDVVRRERSATIDIPAEGLLDLPEIAVQFGTGAFLRGFVEDFVHRANQQGMFGGRIVAVASTGSSRDRALSEQDGLYTLVVEGIENGERTEQVRIISSLSRALSAVAEWPSVLEVARAPELQFVFSNTTEVGIAPDAKSNFDDAPPASFPAKLTRFLYERGRAFEFDAARGVMVIPCELIEGNGDRLRDIVLAIASRWDLGDRFPAWVRDAVPFCNTLVDRIVPGAPSGEDAMRLVARTGYADAMLTWCEPYRLFAIEAPSAMRDRLGWTAIDEGIIVTADIAPYRKRKVHLLNGPHSLLTGVALAIGYSTVRDAISDPSIYQFVRGAMLDEIVPVLDVEGATPFAEAVLDRFRNPFIQHALIDITLQATMKMRVRVVPIIERYMEVRGEVPQGLAFGFAAYLLFMQGTVHAARLAQGLSVPVDDQGDALAQRWQRTGPDAPVEQLVHEIAADTALWGTDLSALDGFTATVAEYLTLMRAEGMQRALDHHLHTSAATTLRAG